MSAQPIKVKKKGGQQQSNGCLFIVGVLLLCGGLGAGYVVVQKVRAGYRAHTEYVPATCTIINKQLIENSSSDGSTYRPEFTFRFCVQQGIEEGSGPEIVVTGYDGISIASSGRAGKEEVLAQYVVGASYTCWYDPLNPSQAVLVKPSAWHLLWLLLPLTLMGFGFFVTRYSILRWVRGPTLETSQPPKTEFGANHTMTFWSKKSIPIDLKIERGQTLAWRLKPAQQEKSTAIGLAVFGLIWTGFTGTFWIHLLYNKEWFGVAFLGLFVLAGLGLLAVSVWQALIAWGIGETLVEVSTATPAPGESFEVRVAQAGRNLKVNRLSLYLACEEKATYGQGTRSRTDTEMILDELQAERTAFTVAGRAEELRCKVTVPYGAMHSFDAENNKIIWKLCVKGDLERWPDFKREYLIRVEPEVDRKK